MNDAYRELLEFESSLNQLQPEYFEWPGELGFEAGGGRRRSPGTDCGNPGSPAALTSQPGGRCTGPTAPVCPAVTGIVSVQGIGNVPFEYVDAVGTDPATHLVRVTRRLRPRRQKFLPVVQTALTQFVTNMQRFGMPIEAILTAGSFCCRCVSHTNTLSNHSYGDAFDLVGVRWAGSNGQETIVHNWNNTAERILLRRINACLRLSFADVIDYHRSDHRDHFHCDMNAGRARSAQDRNPHRRENLRFTQEALTVVLGRSIPVTGRLDRTTQRALLDFGQVSAQALHDNAQLNGILDRLFTRIAAGDSGAATQSGGGGVTQELQPPMQRRPAATSSAASPGTTFYEPIVLGGEANAKPQTGIFIPAGFRPRQQVDLILYFHGMKAPSGFPTSATIAKLWSRQPFLLREAVNDSGKNVILVAPTLGPASQAGRLLSPGGFDWYVDQVMQALLRRGVFQPPNQQPQVGNIILSCHSAGGRVMRPLAIRTHRYSGKLRECWGFDCLYHPCDAEIWRQWAIGHTNVALYVYWLGSTAVQSRDLQGAGSPPVPPPANVKVQHSSAPDHNHVPLAHLKERIQQAAFLQNK
jgi:extensin-like protein